MAHLISVCRRFSRIDIENVLAGLPIRRSRWKMKKSRSRFRRFCSHGAPHTEQVRSRLPLLGHSPTDTPQHPPHTQIHNPHPPATGRISMSSPCPTECRRTCSKSNSKHASKINAEDIYKKKDLSSKCDESWNRCLQHDKVVVSEK